MKITAKRPKNKALNATLTNRKKEKVLSINNDKAIFTDAGFDIHSRKGVMCVVIDGVSEIKEVVVPRIKGLKQYSNFLELIAVCWALRLTEEKNIIIQTDSRVARSWFNRKKNNLDKFSSYHYDVKEELERLKSKKNSVIIRWVPRNKNLAGIVLEKRLLKIK